MVKVKEDLTGKQFGRLTVICQTEDHITSSGKHVANWLCECSCEAHKIIAVIGDNLKHGNTTSCGCLLIEKLIERSEKYNEYDLSGEYGIGWSSNTNQEFYFDLEDYDKIKDYCWCVHNLNGYNALESHGNNGEIIRMHYLIVGKNYDHKNRNPLDNRKNNLRPATRCQNAQNHSKRKNNTSGISGVCWHKKFNKWLATIRVNKKTINIGYFINKEDAIKARLEAEAKYYGEFAPQVDLFEQYNIKIRGELI